ncbi:unnamed protein product, partial [Staurois parvus]
MTLLALDCCGRALQIFLCLAMKENLHLRTCEKTMFSLTGVSELEPDLEYLLMKEQHLERTYRQLLKHVQQHAQESAVPETGALINFCAEGEPAGAPPAEELATGPNIAELCPALV